MLSPADMVKATRGQLQELEKKYCELEVQHAQLNAKYTALCVEVCELKDRRRDAQEKPPANPAPHVTDDTESLGVGNGYLVCSGV